MTVNNARQDLGWTLKKFSFSNQVGDNWNCLSVHFVSSDT